MSQLSPDTSHINNGFGDQNVRVIMGMSGVQYIGSYGKNFFGTSSKYAPPVDNDMAVALSVLNSFINCSS